MRACNGGAPWRAATEQILKTNSCSRRCGCGPNTIITHQISCSNMWKSLQRSSCTAAGCCWTHTLWKLSLNIEAHHEEIREAGSAATAGGSKAVAAAAAGCISGNGGGGFGGAGALARGFLGTQSTIASQFFVMIGFDSYLCFSAESRER